MVDFQNLQAATGAIVEPERVLLVLFIPTQDRDGKQLNDHPLWLGTAQKLLGRLFGGCTTMPPARGAWFNEETQTLIEEDVVLIHSYVSTSDLEDKKNLGQLRDFLHRMGKETKQGEVAFVIQNVFYRIRKYQVKPAN